MSEPQGGTVRVADRVRAAGWPLLALLGLLVLTGFLYMWGLSRSGWANSYYSAAAQAAGGSWKAWFFGSFDSSNFITVDKTPGSLWLMGLSVRIFGLSSWSILVPEALCGVATVGVMYAAVKRWCGPAGGLLAGLAVASTPVAALMFRFNNPEALFTLLLAGAAYALLRGVENGRTRWLILAGALVGFGFLTKMLEAFVVLPVFAVAYLLAGKPRLLKRVWQVALSAVAVAVASGWWVAVVQLWPASSRPFIGGSTTNSIMQLAFGYNGLGRLNGNEVGAVGPQGLVTGSQANAGFFGATGIGRLFRGQMALEISWLLPAALLALAAGIALAWVYRKEARTGRMFRAGLVVWGGWLLVMGGVFSYMHGIIHPYYNIVLAPPMAALLGMVVPELWRRRANVGWRIALGVIPASATIWGFILLGRASGWRPDLRWVLLVIGLAAAVTVWAYDWPADKRWRRATAGAVAVAALVASLGTAGAWTLATAAEAHTGAIPSAGPTGYNTGVVRVANAGGFRGGQNGPGGGQGGVPGGGPGGGAGAPNMPGVFRAIGSALLGDETNKELVALLQKDASSYRWIAVMSAASNAAPVQLATRTPIMALGGFNGTDQSLTLAQFKAYVSAGDVHYYIAGGGYSGSPNTGVEAEIATWVQQNFTKVTVGTATLYDLTAPVSSASS